jgi:hypothetical protein
MPKAPIAPNVHETLDVHGHLGAESTLDLESALDLLPEEVDLFVAQVLGPTTGIHPTGTQNLPGPSVPDPVDIGQGHLDALTPGKINTRNTCHQIVSAVLDTRMRFLATASPGYPWRCL